MNNRTILLAGGAALAVWLLTRKASANEGDSEPPLWAPERGEDATGALQRFQTLPSGTVLVAGHNGDAVLDALDELRRRDVINYGVANLSVLDAVIIQEGTGRDIKAAQLAIVATRPGHRPGGLVRVGTSPPTTVQSLLDFIGDAIGYSGQG